MKTTPSTSLCRTSKCVIESGLEIEYEIEEIVDYERNEDIDISYRYIVTVFTKTEDEYNVECSIRKAEGITFSDELEINFN